jgi:hypothetical protein
MMEAASSSKTAVNYYHTTRRNIPEDGHLQCVPLLHLRRFEFNAVAQSETDNTANDGVSLTESDGGTVILKY